MGTPLRMVEPSLTPNQLTVLQWIANGKRNEDVAEIMGISTGAVQAYMMRVMECTGTNTRAGAVAYGLRHGIIK